MTASTYIQEDYPIEVVLAAVGISRSVYYYKKRNAVQGKKQSSTTRKKNGEIVNNTVVVEDINKELEREFVDYGYIKMTYCLRDKHDYIINQKKVYRLMKEHNLLYKPIARNRSGKAWVKDLVPITEIAFAFWEFDIKYMYIAGSKRNALMLTVLDVKTRYNMGWILEWKINKKWSCLDTRYT